jgi:hypothetical protein
MMRSRQGRRSALVAAWIVMLAAPTQAMDYLEQFDGAGQPSGPGGTWWAKDNSESSLQPTWNDFCPGDGYAHIVVDAVQAQNNDKKYQTITFGDVGPGHRLEIRAKDLVIPGLTGFIFTWAYTWDPDANGGAGEGYFDEIDIEVVGDDGAANHDKYPPDGWSDARFNSWDDANETDFTPFSGVAQAIVDETAQKISHLDGRFHTYTIDWYPDRLQFFIDGVFQHEITSVVPQRSDACAIIGFRDLSWAGSVDWSGQRTCLVDYFRMHPITWGNQPEIAVAGAGNDIPDGDTTPSALDGTDFGGALAGSGTVVRTFTVTNSGTDTLSLYDVRLTGTHASDFTVTTVPDLLVNPGGGTTVAVEFAPSATGTRTATLKIYNDDRNEGPFEFAIQGTGIAAPIPTWIVAGQSNADGYALGYGTLAYGTLNPDQDLADIGRSDLVPEQADVRIFKGGYDSGAGSWQTLAPTFGITWNGARFGPELAFGHDLQAQYGGEIRLIKYARGATSLAVDWNPDDAGTNRYDYFITTVLNAITASGDTLDIRGVAWMQGENDATSATQADAYEANLTQFISSVRADLGLPTLQFYVGSIADTGAWTYRQTIWDAQNAVAAADPDVWIVNGKDLPLFLNDGDGDANIHYTTQGQVTLGERFAGAAIAANPGLLSVSVTATDASASETGPDPGTFTVTRTGDTSESLTVYYTVSGTATPGADYTSIGTSVTLPAGQSAAPITVTPVDDADPEAEETVIVTLTAHASYTIGHASATVTLASSDGYMLPPIHWWKLDGDAQDSVGTLHGSHAGTPAWTDGIRDTCLQSSASHSILFGADTVMRDGDFTMALWFNVSDVPAERSLWSKHGGDWDYGYPMIAMSLNADGRLNLWGRKDAAWNYGQILSTAVGYDDGEWHHVAVTRESGVTRLYVDGSLDQADSGNQFNYAINPAYTLRIAEASYPGLMDDVRLYDAVLSAGEIAILADASAPTAGTVADGPGPGDADTQTSTTSLSATWSGFADPESGVTGYAWAIGTGGDPEAVQAFTSVGPGTGASNDAVSLDGGVTYYVTVRATNGAGLTTDVTSDGIQIVPDTVDVPLAAGYTLIGLPLVPETPLDAESLVQEINQQGGSCTAVIRYANGQYETHPAGSSQAIFPIVPGEGYFIRCVGTGTWQMTGYRYNARQVPLPLNAGYTLVALPLEVDPGRYTSESAAQEIHTQGGSVTQILTYAGGLFVTHPTGSSQEIFELVPGEGYFIRSTGPSVWSVTK